MKPALTVVLSQAAIGWLKSGERGSSSEAIFECMTGIPVGGGAWGRKAHPWDPDDLRRCLLLLDAVPEFALRLHEMKTVSPQWARFVAIWDELAETFRQETGYSSRAPKTYTMMRMITDLGSSPVATPGAPHEGGGRP